MYSSDNMDVERHIKTHSSTAVLDSAAVSVLKSFLRSERIITNFAEHNTWPNHDGTFEYVPNPDESHRPKQNFFVQIKGTHYFQESNGIVKFLLKDLAFPAYLNNNVTLDPGILFVILNPDIRGQERVFWKYLSVQVLNSIRFEQKSVTISFEQWEEIFDTAESIDVFCEHLNKIIDHHAFVLQLENRYYSNEDLHKIVRRCDELISENLDSLKKDGVSRDEISSWMLTRLGDLCKSVLILNAMGMERKNVNLQLAWELSILNAETRYLGMFYKGLSYVGMRIPEEGQSERLMVKYYDFLWRIRKFLKEKCGLSVLQNLESFLDYKYKDELDKEYYKLVATAIGTLSAPSVSLAPSRYYIQKKTPFFVGSQRYYEVTLQLAGIYATKFNRITAYTQQDISTPYSIKIAYENVSVELWGVKTTIKVITNWQVSVDPKCLNQLGKIIGCGTKVSSNYGEFAALMRFLTQSGMTLLELIDLKEIKVTTIVNDVFKGTNTHMLQDLITILQRAFSADSEQRRGKNVIRYLLRELREESFERVMPNSFNSKQLSDNLLLSRSCFPFDKNPFISNLPYSRTSDSKNARELIEVAGRKAMISARPYLKIESMISKTGELYFDLKEIADESEIDRFNGGLDSWEISKGFTIKKDDGQVYIDSYEQDTLFILSWLLRASRRSNPGQKNFNQNYINNEKQRGFSFTDPLKEKALQGVFVNSQILLIYGAAGTGKTTLIEYISNLMSDQNKLFLTKTHTALQNIKRRIKNASNCEFVSIDSFTRRVNLAEYDLIFVDECSTIDNRTMCNFLRKVKDGTFLVLAGDIHQIESIEFGNWFFYAKNVIKVYGANVELVSTWRTEDKVLIGLWDEVRTRGPIISERLAMDGPYSENIGPHMLERRAEDEIVLCLNYDGKFGLNNINNYFQSANHQSEAYTWAEWTYKVGDPILFNDNKRFPMLYNNLKGRIVEIKKFDNRISFVLDVFTSLTQKSVEGYDLDFIEANLGITRLRLTVYAYDEAVAEADETIRMRSVVPFQLAYAVSIHKAQGLEYDSVKVVIPSVNAEKITHGIFYTAITRTKKYLKIFWSADTMEMVLKGFGKTDPGQKSLCIVKSKLQGR